MPPSAALSPLRAWYNDCAMHNPQTAERETLHQGGPHGFIHIYDRKEKEAPLAARLRPETLEEVVGQQHIIGKDKLLYRAIKADKLGSVIFYGPPGTGKTTLARVIANTTSARFTQINATVAGKKDMEEVVAQAKESLGMYGKKTILFIDEIHRFNKGQQDYLLPFVEDGTVILIGATTENPYFEVTERCFPGPSFLS